MAEKVEAYLSNQKNTIKPDEVAENFQVLENYYVRKWWNQVATETQTLVNDRKFVQAVDLRSFYENFIREFEHRINPLVLVEIVMPIAKNIFRKDRAAAFDFLAKFEKTVAHSPEATVRLNAGQIELQLENKDKNGVVIDITNVRTMIENTQKKLDDLPGVTLVHAAFYKMSSVYLKEVGNYAAYYRESLRYLGCENLDSLSTPEKKELATLLGFAALLGQDVYNFGELLAHSILKYLEGTEEQWLLDFLVAFNSGDLAKFRQYESHWSQWPDMVKNRELLETKVRLLCLMEIALARPSKDRNISFTEISQKAQVPLNQVEYLVMKALAKGLIRGSINQVQQVANISWIQPRVLSLEQIANMADRIDAWRKDVEGMESFVSENAKEIIMKV